MNTCDKCGELKVCPKCQPVIEHTNSIIIRHKDTEFNGGYPNALVISPLYVDGVGREISVATLTGDNFFEGFAYYAKRSVSDMLAFLQGCDTDDLMQLFSIKANRKRAVKAMLECVKAYVGEEVPV